MSTVERLAIALTKELADNVRHAVKTGDSAFTREVIRKALRDWQLKRMTQQEQLAQVCHLSQRP
jgi:Arc/MetJ-type ribon-helix-helix transcriptional regulator